MDEKEQRQRKTVQQIIDDQEKNKPMRNVPRVYTENRRPSAHTQWHMEHIPYQTTVGSRREGREK